MNTHAELHVHAKHCGMHCTHHMCAFKSTHTIYYMNILQAHMYCCVILLFLLSITLSLVYYRICSIRCRGYYLFHLANLCGVHSRVVTIQERHLIKLSGVGTQHLQSTTDIRLNPFADVQEDEMTWRRANLF